MCGASTLALSSLGNFLPSIIEGFGYTAAQAQAFSAIPFAVAFFTVPTFGFASDYFGYKGPFVILALIVSVCGYIVLMAVKSTVGEMVGVCLIAAGIYPAVVLKLAWLALNTGGFTKRSTLWALAEVVGQCLAIMGSSVYAIGPAFVEGNSIVLAFLVVAVFLAAGLMAWMDRQNKKRDRILAECVAKNEVHPHTFRSLEEEYDYHINFRYIL